MMFIYDHVFLPTTNNLFPCLPMCVNKFRHLKAIHALLASKRCPLSFQ